MILPAQSNMDACGDSNHAHIQIEVSVDTRTLSSIGAAPPGHVREVKPFHAQAVRRHCRVSLQSCLLVRPQGTQTNGREQQATGVRQRQTQ